MTDDILTPEEMASRHQLWAANWDRVRRDSVIISLKITRWSGQLSLSKAWRERIGLRLATREAQEALNRVLRGGSIEILPAEVIRPMERAEHRARIGLYGVAFKTLWGYMVPASAYQEWREEHEEIRREFEAGVDAMVDGWGQWIAMQHNELISVFAGAWANLRKIGATDRSCQEFVDEALADVAARTPSRDSIRSRYTWDAVLSYPPMADEVAEAEARAQVLREQALSSVEALRDERARVMADIERDAAKRQAAIEESLIEAEEGYWGEVMETVTALADQISGSAMAPKTPLAVQGLASRIRALNIHQREDLSQVADALEASLAQRLAATRDKKPNVQVKELALGRLREAVVQTRQIAQSVSDQLAEMRGARVIGTSVQIVGSSRQLVRLHGQTQSAGGAPRQVARVSANS